ncbi:hypothetical protein Tco_1066541 [Tanacetum coccineum]|uniref:Uncharacterized protein n=1 Tax=Tanacetum coccineum TaxID=301880 RepID=A0ABQ5HBL6_9ASTR
MDNLGGGGGLEMTRDGELLVVRLVPNRYPVITSLIHIESRKSPTAVLFDDDTRRMSIVTVNTKEYHSDVLISPVLVGS